MSYSMEDHIVTDMLIPVRQDIMNASMIKQRGASSQGHSLKHTYTHTPLSLAAAAPDVGLYTRRPELGDDTGTTPNFASVDKYLNLFGAFLPRSNTSGHLVPNPHRRLL
jgi:hypothetical protein